MKKFIILIVSSVFFLNLTLAEDKKIVAESEISEVTVFLDRAQITRFAEISLEPGEHKIIFEDLPNNIDERSIQANGKGDAILRGVKIETVLLDDEEKIDENAILEQKEKILDEIKKIKDEIEAAEIEKIFMENLMKKISDPGKKEEKNFEIDVEKWGQTLSFYRENIINLNQKIRDSEIQIREKNEQINALDQKIQFGKPQKTITKKQAEVIVETKKENKIVINISYIIYGPSWRPTYDLRVSSDSKKVALEYNAFVRQRSSENWENAKIKLSTAKPNLGGSHPELSPWFVDFFKPIFQRNFSKDDSYMKKKEIGMKNMMEPEAISDGDWNSIEEVLPTLEVEKAQVQTGATAEIFQIPGSHTILNDNSEHKLSILMENFPATFRYSTVPKLSQHAFLKTKIKNETDFSFLSGSLNVFLDNNFVSSSELKFVAPGSEFWTFLGVDESIKVEHKLLQKLEEQSGLLSKKNKIIYSYLIEIENNKKTNEEIVVFDQIPIPKNEKIIVNLIEPKFTKNTENLKKNEQNFLEWKFLLEPGQKLKIPFEFSIEYPEGEKISDI